MSSDKVTRRDFLRLSAVGAAGVSGGAALLQREVGLASEGQSRMVGGQEPSSVLTAPANAGDPYDSHFGLGGVGDVDLTDFDPSAYLTDFDYGEVSQLDNGQTLREYTIVSVDKEIEVAPGIYFPAWTYNGQVPGPFLKNMLKLNPNNIHYEAHKAEHAFSNESIEITRKLLRKPKTELHGKPITRLKTLLNLKDKMFGKKNCVK